MTVAGDSFFTASAPCRDLSSSNTELDGGTDGSDSCPSPSRQRSGKEAGEGGEEDGPQSCEVALAYALQQLENEEVSGVLRKLDSIRRLASDAQVLRRRELKEQNVRRLQVSQLHSLLLEAADFNLQAVQQRSVQEMLEGIMLQHAEVFFFSVDDVRKNLVTGPSMKLRDIANRPRRYADKLTVDSEILGRMLTEVAAQQISEIVTKCCEYLTFKQTTYQIKRIEEKDSSSVMTAAGLAFYKTWLYVTDTGNHCIWRLSADRFTAQGNHQVELFAGRAGHRGLQDGPCLDARFHSPMGIAVCERSGCAFVADADNNAIRQVDLKLAVVRTIEVSVVPFAPRPGQVEEEALRQPKGLCVIQGDAGTFQEMEACQQKQCEEFKVQLDTLKRHLHSIVHSPEDASTCSDTASSSEVDAGTSTASSRTSEPSAPSSTGHTQPTKSNKSEPTHQGAARMETPAALLSMEQHLPFQNSTKYAVFQDAGKEWRRERPAWSASTPRTDRPRTTSHEMSGAEGLREEREDAVEDVIRLAVTSDHGVWLVNPRSGKTRHIAGDAEQYGYNDAPLGLAARFSSPRGVISICSVLFVADYWNNVVRCINLYTTQVDTVLDFNPQGPVAMCVSHSGHLHVLDSEQIHYTNILRIMSAPGGRDAGGAHAPAEEKWWYQSLFERPRTRNDSITSHLTEEVWDTIRRKKIPKAVSRTEASSKHHYGAVVIEQPPHSTLSTDFQSRLQDYLQMAADEQEKAEAAGGRGEKKDRKKRKRKHREHQPPEAAERPEDDRMYIDPALVQATMRAREKAQFPAIQVQGAAKGRGARGPNAEELALAAQGGAAVPGGGKDAPQQAPSSGSAEPDQGHRYTISLTAPETVAASSPVPEVDYIQQTRQLLSQMFASTRGGCTSPMLGENAAPMTLSDLGIDSRRHSSARRVSYGAITVDEDRDVSSAIVPSYPSRGTDSSQYRAVYESTPQDAEIAPDAGTVMVSGGKAFYRSQRGSLSPIWTDLRPAHEQRAESASASRRSSMRRSSTLEEGADAAGRTENVYGEDEEGKMVSFIDFAKCSGDMSRRSSRLESRRSSFAGSLRGSRRASEIGLGGSTSRRESVTLDYRRGSLTGGLTGSGSERKSSVQGTLARKLSLLVMPTLFDTHEEEGEERGSDDSDEGEEGDGKGGRAGGEAAGGRSNLREAAPGPPPDAASGGGGGGAKKLETHLEVQSNDEALSSEDPGGEGNSSVQAFTDDGCAAASAHGAEAAGAPPDGAAADDRGAHAEAAPRPEGSGDPSTIMALSQVPFTRDIQLDNLSQDRVAHEWADGPGVALELQGPHKNRRRTTFATNSMTNLGTYKVTACKDSKTWRRLPLQEQLSRVQRVRDKKYPNTPLSLAWYESGSETFFCVGLIYSPTLLKIVPPKLHEPDAGGRFNVLPIDAQRLLLADESCNQIWIVNQIDKTKKHLAGCGKRGYVDGPLEICAMHSPCAMALDPHSHHIYVADKGNHVIRKIDLLSGLMSTVVGSGFRGNCDGSDRRRQALDSPFHVSFSEPHSLIISCADNSIRSFGLRTGHLETLLVGS